jgi:cation:H+ antiporter
MAIGNVVGSNIFNVFWILGLTSAFLQLPFDPMANTDVLVAVMATSALFIAMFVGKRHMIDRWQGILFVSSYIFYLAYLVNRG